MKKKVNKPVLDPKTLANIFKGCNQELIQALTTDYRSLKGAFGFDEEEQRVNQNDRIKKDYKNPNNAKDYLEADRGTEQEIYDAIDDELLSKAKKTLKPGRKYEGEVEKFDAHGNAILSFFGGDIKGMMYNRGKTGLKEGDQKDFVFKHKNERKGRYIFGLK